MQKKRRRFKKKKAAVKLSWVGAGLSSSLTDSRKQLDKLLGLLQWILHGFPSSLYDDMHRPLGTNVSINPTCWAGVKRHLDADAICFQPSRYTTAGTGFLSRRRFRQGLRLRHRGPNGRLLWFSQSFTLQGLPMQSDANLDMSSYLSSYETLAQCLVLLCFWKHMGGSRLALKLPALSDNSGAETVCNKLYTSKVPLNLFVRKLSMWSAITGVTLECSHLAGEKNVDADLLSRWHCSSKLRAAFKFHFMISGICTSGFAFFPQRNAFCGVFLPRTWWARQIGAPKPASRCRHLTFFPGQSAAAARFRLASY